MLVLPMQSAGDLVTLGDDAFPDQVYVSLSRPQVARDAEGRPRLRLLRWVASSDQTRETGGRLSLDVNLAPTTAQMAAAGIGPRKALPLPWLDARVRLDGPRFEPVEAQVSLSGTGVAAFAVDLSPAAAGVLAPLLKGDNVMPLQVTWNGHVQVRLPAVEVIASGDVSEIRRRIEVAGADRQSITTRSIIDANVHIEIRGSERSALEQALRDWALDELTRRFANGLPLSVHVSASDVVHWPITLATTLDDLVAAPARVSLVETLVLDASDVGVVPPIEIRVFGDFGSRLERVDVRLQPLAGDTTIERAFTDQTPQRVPLGTTDFRWAYRVKLADRASGAWSAWAELRHATSVSIPVATPVTVAFEAVAIGLDFEQRWAAVKVETELAMLDGPPLLHTVELDAIHPSQTWTQPLDGARGRLRARVTYVSRRGETVEEIIEDIAGDQIVVRDPYEGNEIPFVVIPAGTGWKDVALAMVDLRYTDGTHVVDETVELRTLDDLVEWRAAARPGGPRRVQWRVHVSFSDGRFESRPWQDTDTGVAVINVDAVARRTVQIIPLYFDAGAVRQGAVCLQGDSQREVVTITDRSPRSVTLPSGQFTWTIAWTSADGTAMPASAPQAGEDVIVLPRFARQ